MNVPRGHRAGSQRWVALLMMGVAGLVLGLSPGLPARGQASGSSEESLRRELQKARDEIRQLQEENARLKGKRPEAPTAPAGAAAVPVPTSAVSAPAPDGSRVVTIPAPVEEGTEVTVERLLADYQASAIAGDARYKGRRLRVSGRVHSFKKAFVGLGWTVQLKAADQLGLVRCQVQFPGISDFRPYPPTLILEGRRPFREWKPLLQQGEKAMFEGVCEGIDDAVIGFKECRPATP
ncbi:MAG: hypothetical protein IT580_07995 [Verrucomicrobiales bacterium]|nr:hypothetical protein [Verrucomicrobiales bacterium]